MQWNANLVKLCCWPIEGKFTADTVSSLHQHSVALKSHIKLDCWGKVEKFFSSTGCPMSFRPPFLHAGDTKCVHFLYGTHGMGGIFPWHTLKFHLNFLHDIASTGISSSFPGVSLFRSCRQKTTYETPGTCYYFRIAVPTHRTPRCANVCSDVRSP